MNFQLRYLRHYRKRLPLVLHLDPSIHLVYKSQISSPSRRELPKYG